MKKNETNWDGWEIYLEFIFGNSEKESAK